MKKSVPAFIVGISFFIISCHKQDAQSLETPTDPITSNLRGESVGGSSGGVTFKCTSCIMSYPDNSNLPRSNEPFSESEVLVATVPGTSTCGTQHEEIKVWYSDEHPICLGVRQVIIKTKTGTTIQNFNITPSTLNSAAMAENILLGATDQSGDYSGNDVAVDGGRPLWPAIFITDITRDLNSRAGDWQQGGQAHTPNKIYGMWKSVVKTVDKTKSPELVSIQVDNDPNKNNGWNLAGGEAPPAGTPNEKYGALVTWNVNDLKFQKGHIYRIQFMVHDGDQNKTGGDVGQSCTTIYIPD